MQLIMSWSLSLSAEPSEIGASVAKMDQANVPKLSIGLTKIWRE